MLNPKTKLQDIKNEIESKKTALENIHKARMAVHAYRTFPSPMYAMKAALIPVSGGRRSFKLLAQGDSWFDYSPGTDLIKCLHENHGHTITNIAVAGSTLNDEAYGPVPRELFGIPGMGPLQSDDPSRIAELVHRIEQDKPDALLLSAGGNDVAGDEFFSFINNAQSGLQAINQEVLDGVVNSTFKTAYEFMIRHAIDAAGNAPMPIFLHGYDYPWPDGRGLLHFLGWRIGPWFDDTFNHKNYPNNSDSDLDKRHNIIKNFIDAVNEMLQHLAQQPEFTGRVFYVDLRNTLKTRDEWANELHPGNDGFAKLAAKIDTALQSNI